MIATARDSLSRLRKAASTARSLVIATGGLSIPKIGASPFGYRIAEQFGLAVVPPKPALVPLAADPELLARFGGLSGASFDAVTACPESDQGARKSPRFREAVLLTHRGLSGPAILQISSYWQQAGGRGAVEIDLLPDQNAQQWLDGHRLERASAGDLLASILPRRVALAFAAAHGWDRADWCSSPARWSARSRTRSSTGASSHRAPWVSTRPR